jgi:hypothetical protein
VLLLCVFEAAEDNSSNACCLTDLLLPALLLLLPLVTAGAVPVGVVPRQAGLQASRRRTHGLAGSTPGSTKQQQQRCWSAAFQLQ